MAIKPPAWVARQGGIPTEKGWKHPNRNEILLAKKFTQAEIDEYLGAAPQPAPEPVVEEVETDLPAADEWQAEDVDGDGTVDDNTIKALRRSGVNPLLLTVGLDVIDIQTSIIRVEPKVTLVGRRGWCGAYFDRCTTASRTASSGQSPSSRGVIPGVL